jgi:monoamine oxidase
VTGTEHTAAVAVVGGGLAGLTAARRLHDDGVDVRLLEARDRVGGRTHSREVGGEVVDLGAQWIGPGQHHVRGLVSEFDLDTFDQYAHGEATVRTDGTFFRDHDPFEALGLATQLNLLGATRLIDHHGERIPLDAPWEAPRAEEWDATTVATWRDRVVRTAAGRDAFDAIVRALFGAEPAELSLLYFLFYIRSGGGFDRITAVRGGAQQTRITRGTQAISEALADELGDRVHVDAPVHRIEHGDSVRVHADGLAVDADYAIVAIPPALAGRVEYDPSLPARRDALTQRMPMGAITKCVATYEEPFWRERGLSGEVVDADGPVGLVFDDSPEDGETGALVGFMAGDAAREWAEDPGGRRERVLAAFAEYFGSRAGDPIEYEDLAWTNERYSRGCYVGLAGPGAVTGVAEALREPVGRIHWAGTETATRWCGYMDGAVRSGKRAAREVGERLG